MIATITAMLASVPTPLWVAIGLVCLPFVIIFGAIGIKLLWGFWPVPALVALAGWGVWHLGIDWFWLIALAIAGAVVATWLWQRTRLFLTVDRALERGMMLGD